MLAHQVAVESEAALRMLDRGLSYEHGTARDQVGCAAAIMPPSGLWVRSMTRRQRYTATDWRIADRHGPTVTVAEDDQVLKRHT